MSVDVSILIGIAGCLVGVVGRMAGRDKHTVRNKHTTVLTDLTKLLDTKTKKWRHVL
jgi:hypothetical protein